MGNQASHWKVLSYLLSNHAISAVMNRADTDLLAFRYHLHLHLHVGAASSPLQTRSYITMWNDNLKGELLIAFNSSFSLFCCLNNSPINPMSDSNFTMRPRRKETDRSENELRTSKWITWYTLMAMRQHVPSIPGSLGRIQSHEGGRHCDTGDAGTGM